jgi:hypothetical protein
LNKVHLPINFGYLPKKLRKKEISIINLYLNFKAVKLKQKHNLKTEKRNRIIIEEVNPNELAEIWKRLSDLNKAF